MRRRQIIIGLAFTSILVLAISPSFAEEIAPGHILNPLGLQLNFTCAYNSENDEYLIAGTGFNSTSGTQPQAFVVHLSPAGTVSGVTYLSPSSLVQEHDIAYNPDRNEYIVVWRNDNLAGYATYLDGNGNEIGSEFLFSSSARSLRVDYSTVSNKYMVSFLSGSDVYYRIIDGDSTSGTPLPEPRRLVQLAAFGPAIAYGSTPDKFLITYHQEAGGGNTDNIYGRFVPGDGNPANMSGRLNIDTQPGLQQASHVAYASSVNRWMVVFSTWENGNRDAKAALVAANGSVVRTTWIATSPLWDVAQAVTYNSATDRFFVVWREEPYGFGRPVNPDTGQREPIIQFSNEDAFFEDACSRNLPAGPQYLGVWRNQLNDGIHAGIVAATPVVVQTGPQMSVDAPSSGATVGLPLTISGWAVDLDSTTGTGVDAVDIWAVPHDGTPETFLGRATLGISRTDIGTQFGDPRFNPSGFSLTATGPLAPGTYSLWVFARSTVTGTFNNQQEVVVDLSAETRMWLDSPTSGASVNIPFTVSGWAHNTGSTSGSGIDYMHVWAFPQNDPNNPIFLGFPTLGLNRPDVGAYYGSSRYDPSGFQLDVTIPLAPGGYTVVVYVHTAVTGDFDGYMWATVTVGSEIMFVDRPTSDTSVPTPFSIGGWAVDRAASSGTGVNSIHVWAVPHDGSTSFFVGSAQYGILRSDIGAYLGDPRFNPSGFTLDNVILGSGTYTLWVNARSTVTGSYTNWTSLVVTVP